MWKKTRLQPRVGTPSSRFITHPLAFIVFKAVVAFYILPSPTCSEGSLGLNSVFGFSTQFFIPLLHLTCDHRNLACGWESADGVRACVWVCVSVCVFGRRVCVSACLPSASCRDYITVCLEKHRRVSAVHMLGELKKKKKQDEEEEKKSWTSFALWDESVFDSRPVVGSLWWTRRDRESATLCLSVGSKRERKIEELFPQTQQEDRCFIF